MRKGYEDHKQLECVNLLGKATAEHIGVHEHHRLLVIYDLDKQPDPHVVHLLLIFLTVLVVANPALSTDDCFRESQTLLQVPEPQDEEFLSHAVLTFFGTFLNSTVPTTPFMRLFTPILCKYFIS